MVAELINEMLEQTIKLQGHILEDIEDIKAANHEKLLDRNEDKLEMMQNLASKKEDLNKALHLAIQNNEDINQYRTSVDQLGSRIEKTLFIKCKTRVYCRAC
jgi:hypothetical protein